MFKGVILSVMASFTFGVLYFYTQLLSQLDSEQTFGWRIIATLPFLTLFMWWSGDLAYIKNIYQRILAKPSLLLLLITTSILTSVQLWLFPAGIAADRCEPARAHYRRRSGAGKHASRFRPERRRRGLL